MGCGASSSSGYVSKDTVQLTKPDKKRLGGDGTKASPTLWVGGIPASHANPDALQKAFEAYGHVLSIKVRYKPGENKSWAFVTMDTTGNATQATKATCAHAHSSRRRT
jgi:RNA recognition motif-containing protein